MPFDFHENLLPMSGWAWYHHDEPATPNAEEKWGRVYLPIAEVFARRRGPE